MTSGFRRASLVIVSLAGVGLPAPAAGGDFAGTVQIDGGRRMYLECRGSGAPIVVFVSGLKASADDWDIAAPEPTVFAGIAQATRACAFDRPGVFVGEGPSRSDPVAQPTTAADAVADLHALLAASAEPGPYVFVAHSYGGLVARLYAMTYPGEVSGMVLVDALSEGLQDAETAEEWPVQRRLMEGDITEALIVYPALERIDPDQSFAQLRAAPPLQPMPLVVLSADRPWGPQVKGMIEAGLLAPDTPPVAGYVTDRAQKVAHAGLALLVPGARHVRETNAGHEIHKEQPQLVIDSVLDVLEAVRRGATRLEP